MSLLLPSNYHNLLETAENTEKAIKSVKDMFQINLSAQLSLMRVTAPMMVISGTGLNDDLNGVERPVRFPVKDLGDRGAEIVHSLAKWKRVKLASMKVRPGRGIYTDMNALRPDEELDNIHSIYVDQWDWERVIDREDRNTDFLKKIVCRIYEAIKVTENRICLEYPQIEPCLSEEIYFISSQELLDRYPDLTPKQREDRITSEYGSVFIMGIGSPLSDGRPHDTRAADYDDWELNGDLLVWNPVLNHALELSSMGVRVDEVSLLRQLEMKGEMYKKDLYYHGELLAGRLPYTIGGGIGQSRLCMFLLRKAHIGEIQCSIWSDEMRRECAEAGIILV